MNKLASLAAVLFLVATLVSGVARADGASNYTLYCSGCHGPAGNNKDNIWQGATRNGGADMILTALNTVPQMKASPAYDQYYSGGLTYQDLQDLAAYIDSTIPGGGPGNVSAPATRSFGTVNVGSGNTAGVTVTITTNAVTFR
jgi:cytochrome c553